MFVWVFPPDIDWYKGMVGCDLHQLLLLQFCLLKGRKLKMEKALENFPQLLFTIVSLCR